MSVYIVNALNVRLFPYVLRLRHSSFAVFTKMLYFPLRKSSFVWCARCFWFKWLNMFFFLSFLFLFLLFFQQLWIWRQVFSFAMGTILCSACLRIFTWRFRPILFFFQHVCRHFFYSFVFICSSNSIVIWFSRNEDTRTQNNRRKKKQLLRWCAGCWYRTLRRTVCNGYY